MDEEEPMTQCSLCGAHILLSSLSVLYHAIGHRLERAEANSEPQQPKDTANDQPR